MALPEDKPPVWLTVVFFVVILLAAARLVAFTGFFDSGATETQNQQVSSPECSNITEENGHRYCMWQQRVFDQGCSQNCAESGSGSKTIMLPIDFSDVRLTYLRFDDSGSVSVNGVRVYSTGSGCNQPKYPNLDITEYVHAGANTITADVSNDCGLSMSAEVAVKYMMGGTASKTTTTLKKQTPFCGDAVCTGTENCRTCPTDCKCTTNAYTVDLPDDGGRSWSIKYTPNSESIFITASECFYLDVLDNDGKEIDPLLATRGGTIVEVCNDAGGKGWPATGNGSASWFNWGGCADRKGYTVTAGQTITLKPSTDDCSSCVCNHPNFNIYEMKDGGWVKVESLL